MKLLYGILVFVEILALAFGIYNEIAPKEWPLHTLPDGMGLAIALIAMAMAPASLELYRDRVKEDGENSFKQLVSQSQGIATACHERDFYHNWSFQIPQARNTVDITHLGVNSPRSHHESEVEYFKKFKKLVKSTPAHVRKVERITEGKAKWIRSLVKEMTGVSNFSLALYRDPIGDEETPASVSVCRIDNTIAWLIALAEHQATIDVRDIMITDPKSVELISRYFQKRIWERSVSVIASGNTDGEALERALKSSED